MSTFDVARGGETDEAALLAAVASTLPAGFWSSPCLVAVSGGADSVALLLALHRLAPAAARLVVAHVEHGLRETACRDRDFVVGLAADLGRPCSVQRVAVRDADRAGVGLEAAARRLRYAALEEAARAAAARHVAVAHTADDQAETVLHRILRGTGLAGLAGMAAARELCPGVGLVRPLLGVTRQAVRQALAGFAAAWCEDESNADVRHARNFLRHEVLPRCTAGPYPAAAAALVRLAGQAATAAAAVRSAAERLLETHAVRRSDGTVVVRATGLAGLHPQLLAEMVVTLWVREDWPRRDMTAAHYESLAAGLAAVARGDAQPPACDVPGGIRVSTDRDALAFAPAAASTRRRDER